MQKKRKQASSPATHPNKGEQSFASLSKAVHDCLHQHLKANNNRRLLLALSGGVDSIVLLHILFNLQSACQFKLSAMHVHHGLSAHADTWAASCQSICDALEVPLAIEYVNVDRSSDYGS